MPGIQGEQMATDLEKLVVSLSADFKSYENAMAKASGITRKQLAQIKADAVAAGGGSVVAFDGAARSAKKFGSGASAAARQVAQLKGQTGNLAAQFNDIGVQLAGGQSPFLIALQQGTQINQVLGGAGARGAVAALGGAFMSLLNPVSLATIGIIAAGGAAVQYFSSLFRDGDKSAEELKKQSDLIRQVAKDWGDAVPGIRAYADQLERAARSADILQAAQSVQDQIAGKLLERFRALTAEHKNAISLIPDVNREYGVLAGKMESGGATTEDFQRILDILASVLDTETSPALETLRAALAAMQAQAAGAASSIAQVGNEAAVAAGKVRDFAAAQAMRDSTRSVLQDQKDFVAEQDRLNSLTADQLAMEREIASVRSDAERDGTVIDATTATRLAQDRLAAEKARAEAAKAARSSGGGGGGGRSASVSEAEREREAVIKLIEALQFEQSLIGATDLEREKANQLRRAGTAATAEQRAQIEGIVTASYAMTEELARTEEQMEALKDLSRDVLGGMVEDLIDGADAADVLSNALARVGGSLIQSGLDALIEGAFAGRTGSAGGIFGGRIIPGILHSGGIAGVDGYGHGRSVSPAVFANARRMHTGGIAGLMPGEVPAILQKGERVIPRGGSGGGNMDVRVYVDQDGNWQAAVERIAGARVRGEAPRIVGQSVKAVRDGNAASARFLSG